MKLDDLVKRLRHAITTMTNDDVSAAGTEQRRRFVERIDVMQDAAAYLTALGDKPVAWRVSCPADEHYGTGPDKLQFHPLGQHDIDAGYSQAPLFTSPQPVAYEHVKLPGTFKTPAEFDETINKANYRPLFTSPPPVAVSEAMVERIARVIELAIMRHGVEETALEGTLDDAEAVIAALAADGRTG